MLTVSVRSFCLKPTEYLSLLPLQLTRYKKPVAYLVKEEPDEPTAEAQAKEFKAPKIKKEKLTLCKHGSAKGLCKFGC